ncbi:MAG TPA: hypothetical protein VGG41_06800 [Solirubrobacteraceae bacterium]|jgi:hypothetical protein
MPPDPAEGIGPVEPLVPVGPAVGAGAIVPVRLEPPAAFVLPPVPPPEPNPGPPCCCAGGSDRICRSETLMVGDSAALARTVSMWPLIGRRTRTVVRCRGPRVRARRESVPIFSLTSPPLEALTATLTSNRPLDRTGSRTSTS